MKNAKKKISGFAVAEIILIVILALIMITMLTLNIFFKDKDSAVSVFGYSFYNTKDVTMLRSIPANTLVIAKASEKENVKEGSVVLCRIGENTALMKVDHTEDAADGKYYIVKFDYAAEDEAVRINSDAVIAKAMWQIDGFGNVIDFAGSTVGIIVSVVVPLLFIIAIQVARIISIRKAGKVPSDLEDIGDIMVMRDDDEPAALSFTEPKFIEDVTGKFSKPAVPVSEDQLPQEEEKPAPPKNSPLLTYEQILNERKQLKKEPVAIGAGAPAYEDEFPARTAPEYDPTADKFTGGASSVTEENTAPAAETSASGSVVFTPHLDNILPENSIKRTDNGRNASSDASRPKEPRRRPSSFDESVRSYLDKKYAPEEDHHTVPAAAPKTEIPVKQETAAAPVPENIVPAEAAKVPEAAPATVPAPAPAAVKKKKKADVSFDELMSMIDKEKNKLDKK